MNRRHTGKEREENRGVVAMVMMVIVVLIMGDGGAGRLVIRAIRALAVPPT